MIVYFDTSAFLPLVVSEPGTEIALRLWREADRVISSRLVVVESAAALAQAQRLGRIAPDDDGPVQSEAGSLVHELTLIDVTMDVVEHAARLAVSRALRGYDAVHLATATLLGATEVVFASGDRRLLTAASAEGLITASTSPHLR